MGAIGARSFLADCLPVVVPDGAFPLPEAPTDDPFTRPAPSGGVPSMADPSEPRVQGKRRERMCGKWVGSIHVDISQVTDGEPNAAMGNTQSGRRSGSIAPLPR
eukprot:scaffold370_cov349-Pavlova_lutheri.AAC.32